MHMRHVICSVCSALCLVWLTACITSKSNETVSLQKEADNPLLEKAEEINAEAELTDNHPEVEKGISCNECHEIKLDAQTTATQAWMNGDYLAWSANEGIMSEAEIWEQIVKILGGRKAEQKTFVLATSINNTPLTTTAEFTLDPEEKVLYGFHEKGTEKLAHIKNNPRVSLNWHLEFESFTNYLCMQILGRAELIDSTSKDYERILIDIIPYEMGAKARKMDFKQFRDSVRDYMVICKITIDRVTIANYAFNKEGFRTYQRWTR